MKPITTCHSRDAVRHPLDSREGLLWALNDERGADLHQEAHFRKYAAELAAAPRLEQVITGVKARAAVLGADPGVVGSTWRAMLTALIALEQCAHGLLPPSSP